MNENIPAIHGQVSSSLRSYNNLLKFIFLRPALAGFFLIIVWLLCDLGNIFWGWPVELPLILSMFCVALSLVPIIVFMGIKNSLWKKFSHEYLGWKERLWRLMSSLIVTFVFFSILFFGPNYDYIGKEFFTSLMVSLFKSQDHSKCISTAIEWSPNERLGICEKRDNIDVVYFRGFVFDSSDEILLPNNRRSPKWQKVAMDILPLFASKNVKAEQSRDKEDGINITVRPIGQHFYYVTYDTATTESAHFF